MQDRRDGSGRSDQQRGFGVNVNKCLLLSCRERGRRNRESTEQIKEQGTVIAIDRCHVLPCVNTVSAFPNMIRPNRSCHPPQTLSSLATKPCTAMRTNPAPMIQTYQRWVEPTTLFRSFRQLFTFTIRTGSRVSVRILSRTATRTGGLRRRFWDEEIQVKASH